MDFKLHEIEAITNNFAEAQKIGSGGYGDVYRAMHQGEEIAVKKLHRLQGLDDKQFHSEFRNLSKVRHQNVVRLIGYCYEARTKYIEYNGELVFATTMERVLCFEYMQGGSLDKYIQDEACGLEWPTCYKIIKGTCEGINYLHSSQGKPIFHLNLKPSNILLDRSMTPKIAGLGLSRLVDSIETDETDMRRHGAPGFLPPEFVDSGLISKKFDVFSLGVIIIKILAGNKGYYVRSEMSPEQFIELVQENWTKRLQAVMRYSFKEDILRVKTCVQIALRCVDSDRNKRPAMTDIVHELEELEANITIISNLFVQEEEEDRPVSLLGGRYSRSMDFKLDVIEAITNNFAEAQKVGSGGYGDVYRAMHQGEEIAVKKLHQLQGLDDKQLHSEFRNLSKVRHQNVVRLIGYCYESRHKYMEHNGELVFAKMMERVLCFEYMQGGSLDKYIQDESCGLEWPTCYKIIKGTCEGLNYLHSSQGKPIFHLNLKPGNILLDRSMTPKIADLGLSMLVASIETDETEMRRHRAPGFMPPEYVDSGLISNKFDVFSLGVIIIKMLAGDKSYFRCSEMSPEQFIELVRENWMKKLQANPGYSSQEIDILGVTSCVEIALRCVDKDRNKRPCINDIVDELKALEAKIEKMYL